MPQREIVNNAKREKRMADFVGHSSTSEATKSITDNFQVLTYNSISFIYRPRGRVNIRLSLLSGKGGRCVFILNESKF